MNIQSNIPSYSEKMRMYLENPGINQSLLKDVWEDPKCIDPEYRNNKKKKALTTGMNVGSLVDLMLVLPPEEFVEHIYVDTVVPPNEGTQMRVFCDFIINKCYGKEEKVSDITMDIFEMAYEKAGFGRDSFDKVLNTRFPAEGYVYVESRLRSVNRLVVSEYEHNRATDVYNSITTHPFTAKFLQPEEGVEIDFQVPMFFTLNLDSGQPVNCKALLDIVITDHNQKRITWFDLKCIDGHINRFEYSYEKFQYNIQGAWYYAAIKQNAPAGYKIGLPAFMVECFSSAGNPGIFVMSSEELHAGEHGGRNKRSLRQIIGYKEMLKTYMFYIDSKQTAYTQEQLNNQGVSTLNLINPL